MIGQWVEEDKNMEVEQYRSFKKKKKDCHTEHEVKFALIWTPNTWNKRNPLASDRKRKCLSRRNSTGTTEPKPSLSTRGVKVCGKQQKMKIIQMTKHTYRPRAVVFICYLSIKK